MTIVRSDFLDAERELLDYIIYEVDCIGLGVFFIHLECSDTRSIVDCRILKAADFLSALSVESQNLTSI